MAERRPFVFLDDNTIGELPSGDTLPETGGGVLPVVTGEIINGQPVFVYADNGSLVYSEVV